MNSATYGDKIADVYDELYGDVSPAAIEMLASLAGTTGRALELGIGTGRMALPLTAKGVEVHGIDASSAMLDKLRGKPGADQIPVTVADFVNACIDRKPVQPTFEDGLKNQMVLAAVEESVKTGKWVKV